MGSYFRFDARCCGSYQSLTTPPELHRRASCVSYRITVRPDLYAAVTFTDTIFLIRDRMLASALNFASGFWGIPFEDKYLQSITIEARGVSSPLTWVSRNDLDFKIVQ